MANAGFVSRTQGAAHSCFDFEIRQASSTDCAALSEFLAGLSPRVRYLRFFAGAPPTGPAMLRILTGGTGGTEARPATGDGVRIAPRTAKVTPPTRPHRRAGRQAVTRPPCRARPGLAAC